MFSHKKPILALTILGIILAPFSSAAEIKLAANTIWKGQATVTVTVDQNGKINFTVDQNSPITITSSGGTPEPDPKPAPDLSPRAVAVRDAALKVSEPNRDQTAQELAVLYAEIAKKVKAGEIKGQETISMVVKSATDWLLTQKNATAAWKPTRDVIGVYWVKLAQEGGKDADFAKLLEDASDGFEASVKLPQAIDIQMILKIIQMILEMLKLLQSQVQNAG